MPKPGGIGHIGAACRGVARHPADYLVQYGIVRLPYAQAVPRLAVRPVEPAPFQVPGALGEVPCQPPMERPLLGFQDGRRYGRGAPVPLAFGKARQIAHIVGYLSRPFHTVAALGLAALGIPGPVNVRIVPLAGGVVLASGQVWLAYLWPSVFCSCQPLGLEIHVPFGPVRVRFCPSASLGVSVFGQGRAARRLRARSRGGEYSRAVGIPARRPVQAPKGLSFTERARRHRALPARASSSPGIRRRNLS